MRTPLAVDGRVRAAVDHRAAALGDLDPVAVPPDAGIGVEVALAVALAVRVVPEVDRHRGHRLRDHELADLAHERAAVGCPTPPPPRPGRVPGARPRTPASAGSRRRTPCRGRCHRSSSRATRRRFTCSYTHSKPSERQRRARGPELRRRDRSPRRAGSTPAFMQAVMKPALVPKQVTPASSRSATARAGRADRRTARSWPRRAARPPGSSTSSSRWW